jgi:serine/threonine-protein kinase
VATCPKCFTRYPDETVACEADGEALVPDAAIASMDRDVLPGAMIGEYKVEAKLGEGGFGAVYRAIQPLIGKQVAIKILSRKLCGDPQMLSRFVAEARVVNDIKSKNIVDIFGYGALPDGRQYFVMELLTGTTLEDWIHQRGRIPIEEAVPIFRGIARALDSAHAKGVVHRDLKPENVFLVSDDGGLMPKLLDFGIAKLMGGATGGHKTRTGVPMGTPYYMSPEQCRGDKIDHATDVYSFGVLAFQTLTGQLPFSGDSFMQIMFAHVSSQPPLPSAVAAGLPAELDAPILAMLAKSPVERPESCGAGVEALATAGRSAGHDVGTLPIGTPLAMREPGAVTGGGLALAATAVATTGPSTLSASETSVPLQKSRAPLVLAGVALLAVVGIGVAFALTRGSSLSADSAPPAASSAPVAASATPSAVPSAAPPAPSVAPAASTKVKVTLTTVPEAVEVFLGEEKLGATPGDEIRLPRGDAEVVLELRAEGFSPEKVRVSPVADVSVSVKLKKVRAAPSGGGKPKTVPGALEY